MCWLMCMVDPELAGELRKHNEKAAYLANPVKGDAERGAKQRLAAHACDSPLRIDNQTHAAAAV